MSSRCHLTKIPLVRGKEAPQEYNYEEAVALMLLEDGYWSFETFPE